MPTASYTKFQPAVENLVEGANVGTDSWVLKLATAINITAGSITEVANGGGYTTGGVALAINTATHLSGSYSLVFTQPTNPLWTASTGFTFQYVVLVNSTTGTPYGAWDYGSSQAVAAGETLSVTLTTAFTVA